MAYTAGSVWWGSIDFGDGQGPRKKYFVLLTDCTSPADQSCAALTTSQTRYGPAASTGSPCVGPAFRIDAGQEACFPAPTWVQFDNAYPISRAGLDTQKQAGKADFIQALDSQRLRSLLNCAKKSNDIPVRDLARIDQTLKAMNSKKAVATPPTAPAPAPATPLQSAYARVGAYCDGCRTMFLGLACITSQDLTSFANGSTPPPPTFLEDATLAFEMIAAEGCDKCAK